jgi:serine/threonine protein kinase
MKLHCTRPNCTRPSNEFPELDDESTFRASTQRFCMNCRMPLYLESRYVPIGLLDTGGFGAAFLARDRLTPKMRQCVVKRFHPSTPLNPQQLAMAQELFRREAEGLEELGAKHSQIPNLFASFELSVPTLQGDGEERFFYLVLELVDGDNLEKIARHKAFTEDELLDFLRQFLPILEFIHSHNVIHRDIKPSNIMRDRSGKLYLLDFGAIKNVTQPGRTIIYSQGYAPPEQLIGQQVYFSTDIYALGTTCLFLLTHKKPEELFDSATNQWVWQNHVSLRHPELRDILNKMLLLAPVDRFQTATEILVALAPLAPPAPSPAEDFGSATVYRPPPALPLHKSPLGEYLTQVGFAGGLSGILWPLADKLSWPGPLRIPVLLLTVGAFLYLQSQRIITKRHYPIVIAVSLVVILLVVQPTPLALFIAIGLGVLVSINLAVIFRIVYRLLSQNTQ